MDIDHITSITKRLDSEQNWALTHSRENRSKGNRDLQLMQHIYKYRKDRENFLAKYDDFNVGHALDIFFSERNEVLVRISDSTIEISYLGEEGKSVSKKFEIVSDKKTTYVHL